MKTQGYTAEAIAIGVVLLLGSLLVLRGGSVPGDSELGSYSTDLTYRTPHQRHNARRAAAAIDGLVILPHGTFSFDDVLHGWTADQGFLKAPVSYDGTLVDDYGGGVCETSTTLYDAALLAGLPILERHPHSFSPSYAPPGRDAAVAYPSADLRFANPYSWPITLHIRPWGSSLVCRIQALHNAPDRVAVSEQILGRQAPSDAPVVPGSGAHRSRWTRDGRDGLRVAVMRTWYHGSQLVRREQVSDDTYFPISRVNWSQ